MARHTVVSMPGDGIGNQVLPESIRVLNVVGFDAEYIHADIGWDFWCKEGNALPDRTIDLLARHKLGLFGAITSKPKKEADAELDPKLRGKGYVYYSPIVTMRQRFNLDICMRPCVGFTGNPLNYVRKRTDGGVDEPQINTTVSGKIPRECTRVSSGRILLTTCVRPSTRTQSSKRLLMCRAPTWRPASASSRVRQLKESSPRRSNTPRRRITKQLPSAKNPTLCARPPA